ncbi:MAG: aminotransferase class III-fold pyridoxal phosphate-dependent enzyme, partial [Bacteroidia bacterium]|nr:aminotransferase class III-fold pyridoxal phosphate-dependent enzyme [Bacteroidia bacterium]
LQHPLIQEIRGKGLMLALILPSAELVNKVILECQEAGLILFWLLFEPRAIRITPPLNITNEELTSGCEILIKILDRHIP